MTARALPPGEPGRADRVRLFAALELPPPVVDALVAWRAPLLQAHEALRAVGAEGLHVTLCFLGERPVSTVGAIGAAVVACGEEAGRVPDLALAGGLWLPPRRPRVLALGVADPSGALGALQRALTARLAAGGWYEPEARPYLPHVTVARVRGGSAGRSSAAAPPPLEPVAFAGAAVTLFRSRLQPTGSRYEALFRHALA